MVFDFDSFSGQIGTCSSFIAYGDARSLGSRHAHEREDCSYESFANMHGEMNGMERVQIYHMDNHSKQSVEWCLHHAMSVLCLLGIYGIYL